MEPFRPLERYEYDEPTYGVWECEAQDEQNRRPDGGIADRVYLSRPEEELGDYYTGVAAIKAALGTTAFPMSRKRREAL